MKRILSLLVCLAMLAVCLPLAAQAGSYAVVNNPNPADRLHLRERPDENSTSLGKYYNGVTVTVIGWHGELNYAKVEIGNLTGYMDAKYLTYGQDAKKVKSAIPTVKVKNPVDTQQLNLRRSRSETSASLGKYSNGTEVKVLGVGPTWYHVEVNGKIGFMMMKYLSPTLPK